MPSNLVPPHPRVKLTRHEILGIIEHAKKTSHHEEVTTLQDVIDAYNAIETAWENYRAAVRRAIAAGVRQSDIARHLNRTREMIRRDAMPEDQRKALAEAEKERLRQRRQSRNQ